MRLSGFWGVKYPGTYVVKNGYIVCTNDIGGVIEVPYTYENGTVKIDSIAAFDFMK